MQYFKAHFRKAHLLKLKAPCLNILPSLSALGPPSPITSAQALPPFWILITEVTGTCSSKTKPPLSVYTHPRSHSSTHPRSHSSTHPRSHSSTHPRSHSKQLRTKNKEAEHRPRLAGPLLPKKGRHHYLAPCTYASR
jgi:hypothetical protein